MSDRSRLFRIMACAVLAVALPALALPGAAAESPLETIERDLQGLRAQYKNAKFKLRYVAGGDKPSSGQLRRARGEPLPQTAANCCSRNIERMTERITSILGSIQELHRRASAAEDATAKSAVAHMAETARAMQKALDEFAGANEPRHAQVGLELISSAYSHFRQATDKYLACCVEPADRKGDKKPKKQKKKEKQADKDRT